MSQILKRKNLIVKENANWLKKLQAGILKGNGRDHLFLLKLKFITKKKKELKKILSKLVLTSAYEQLTAIRGIDQYKTITNLYLSSTGYRVLEIDISESNNAFRDGLKNRVDEQKAHILNDKPNEWEESYKNDIHGILSLANDNIDILIGLVSEYQKKFEDFIKVISIEKGTVIKNENKRPIEHFGYVDGISQPLFLKEDLEKINKTHWDPSAPLSLALVKDFGTISKDCYGSYMVFRKLEQNVKAFKAAEKNLAKRLNFTGNSDELAGAAIIGRFENGLPIIKHGSTHSPEVDNIDNNFNYSLDPNGDRCPFQSHIRKCNPRGDNKRLYGHNELQERKRRIVRRGITYGKRNKNFDKYPSKGVGLLFICFQSNIAEQFEFIQKNWVNNNDFPIAFTGIDPIIGQGKNRSYNNGKPLEQQWKKANRANKSYSISSFVTMKGGEYFFAPSIPFINSLNK